MNKTRALSLCLAVAAGALLGARSAAAEPEPAVSRAAPKRNAVSLHLANLGASTVALQYERFLSPPRWSLAGTLGARRSARGDYRAAAASAGAELRYWLTGSALLSDLPPGSMAGWFAAARLDVGYTATFDRIEDRRVGSHLGISETLALGYRIVPWRGLAVSAEGGFSMRTEIDPSGRLPPWNRSALALALTVDWLW